MPTSGVTLSRRPALSRLEEHVEVDEQLPERVELDARRAVRQVVGLRDEADLGERLAVGGGEDLRG